MSCLKNNCTCKNRGSNLVYLTKVFFDAEESASPILTPITNSTEFTQQLSIGGGCHETHPICCNVNNCSCNCGCTTSTNCCDMCREICCCCCNMGDSCSNFEITPCTTFEITNAFVVTRSLNIANPAPETNPVITVDGIPVTNVTSEGGQFLGDISGIMHEISKCPCTSPCTGNCPGNFVFLSVTGPWSLSATIVIEGKAYDNGKACNFRLCFTTLDGNPIPVGGNSSFAFCGTEIPCQTGGISPSLLFDFDACASLLNPVLTATTDCNVMLRGSLVVTPKARLRVTRPSLFNINALEIDVPCDDIGQCNACNPDEANCLTTSQDECCCGHPAVNRVDEMLSASRNSTEYHCCGCECERETDCGCGCGKNCGCGCDECKTDSTYHHNNICKDKSNYAGITCQCCDTNGYTLSLIHI